MCVCVRQAHVCERDFFVYIYAHVCACERQLRKSTKIVKLHVRDFLCIHVKCVCETKKSNKIVKNKCVFSFFICN